MKNLTYEQRQAKVRGFLAGMTRKLSPLQDELRAAGFSFARVKGSNWHGRTDNNGIVFADFLRNYLAGSSSDIEQLLPILQKAGIHAFRAPTRLYAAQTAEDLEVIRERVEAARLEREAADARREAEQQREKEAAAILARAMALVDQVGIDALERMVSDQVGI